MEGHRGRDRQDLVLTCDVRTMSMFEAGLMLYDKKKEGRKGGKGRDCQVGVGVGMRRLRAFQRDSRLLSCPPPSVRPLIHDALSFSHQPSIRDGAYPGASQFDAARCGRMGDQADG